MNGQEGAGATERLGPYRLVTRIGEGGMGVVHLGLDAERRTVAVKVLRPQVAADEVSRARLAREVETMRRVISPHVAEVLDADVHGERPYIVTRYVQGRTLQEVVEQDGPLTSAALTRLARGLADALAAIHSAHVVHRDVKPSNVVIVDGEPVIIDFGVAQAADAAKLTETGMFLGTPAYLAPEVIEGAAPGSGADVHAWAAVVAFAATGRSPFGAGSYEHVFANIARGRADLSGVPEPLGAIVRAALARDPAGRPSATWLRERAARLHEGGDTTARLRRGAARVGTWAVSSVAGRQASGAAAQVPPNYSRTRAYTGQSGPGTPPPYIGQTSAGPHSSSGRPVSPGSAAPGTRPYPSYGAPPASYGPPAAAPSLPPAPQQGSERLPPRPAQQAGGPEPTPSSRPRRRRPVAGWLCLLVVAGFVSIAPGLGALAVAGLLTGLRTSDGVATGLAARRSRRGPRDVDPVLSVAGLPWHISRAAVGTAVQLVVPLLAAVAVGGLLLADPRGGRAGAATLGACAFVLLAFFGPGSQKPRQRGAGVLSSVLRGRTGLIVTVIVLVFVFLLELSAMESRILIWWPLPQGGPPWL